MSKLYQCNGVDGVELKHRCLWYEVYEKFVWGAILPSSKIDLHESGNNSNI